MSPHNSRLLACEGVFVVAVVHNAAATGDFVAILGWGCAGASAVVGLCELGGG